MVKSAENIERDVYNIIKKSLLGSAIKGAVYRKDMRLDDAKTEDIVVKFLAGLNTQVQHGVVVVNIYVPDIEITNRSVKVKNLKRVEFFQDLVNEVLEAIDETETEYEFETDSTPTSMKAEGMEQHFINVRLNFKRITF